ncbi:hypothetical protein ACLKA6_013299 [Drosophila palustris]
MRIEAFILPHIITDQPAQNINNGNWKMPKNHPLADPQFNNLNLTGKIDMLIGAEHYYALLLPQQHKLMPSGPMMHQTKLGHMDKSPAGAAALMNDFYVDDCLTGADSAQEAIHIREELVKILRPNGFNLRKWCSNNDQLLHGIPKDDVASDVKFDDSLDSHRIKTLGLIWMPKKDQLCGRAQSSTALKITKRVVCSELAQIFDPLGLFAPVVVKAKIFMQRLWEDKLEWDTELPTDLQNEWKDYRDEHSNSFYKLQRIVAYMLRFCYKGYRATTTTVCTKELDRSRNLILRTIQQAEFPADLKMLQRYNTVDRKSSISSLSPVLGSDGLMRVGGRLEQAPLPYNAKHQILLPYNDPIVKMLLRELHEDNMHCDQSL